MRNATRHLGYWIVKKLCSIKKEPSAPADSSQLILQTKTFLFLFQAGKFIAFSCNRYADVIISIVIGHKITFAYN